MILVLAPCRFPVESAFINGEFSLPFGVSSSGLKPFKEKVTNRAIIAEGLAEFL